MKEKSYVEQEVAADSYHPPVFAQKQNSIGEPILDSANMADEESRAGIAELIGGPGAMEARYRMRQNKRLKAQYDKDLEEKTIKGRCFLSQLQPSSVELPCPNLSVVLTDLNGLDVATAKVNDLGEFLFFVNPDKKYTFHIDSRRFRSIQDPKRPILVKERVTLHVYPIAGTP